jgi:hypothetical protein
LAMTLNNAISASRQHTPKPAKCKAKPLPPIRGGDKLPR